MYYLEIKRIRIRTVVSCLQINTIQSEGASLPALASVRYGTALRITNALDYQWSYYQWS